MMDWKFLLSLSLLYYIILVIHAGFIQDKLFEDIVVHLDRVNGECRGHKVPCQAFFQGVKTISTTLFIRNYTVVIKEGSFKKVTLSITLDRCLSKENLDTCEEYFKQPNIDFCKMFDPNNLIIGKTIKPFPLVPPPRCPFNKGIYHAYNFSYDLAPFFMFKVEGWYWKLKNEFFDAEKNKLISCAHYEGYVTNSKSKKR